MRLNFEFSEEQVADLKELQQKTGIATTKDLFNQALSLLEWAVDETANGNEIAAVSEDDKNYRVLVTPLLQRVKKQHQRTVAAV
jgi:hypothetical protein